MEYEYLRINNKEKEALVKPRRIRLLLFLPWLVSITFAVLFFWQLQHRLDSCQPQYDFASGFKTEFSPAKQYISIEENEFHLPYIPGNDEFFEPPVYEYVGAPTERLDIAWKKLLFALNLDLAEEEAMTIKDDTFRWNDTHLYYTGIQLYHQLHCVDIFRRAIYHDHYGKPTRKEMFHIGTCIALFTSDQN
ncbi:uncharacterized protein RAG0_16203 [Rhynchosporium agropyri]|uniref:Uncharacterized protein n=1 Tax=Rhynchosporium agropyri TaxID=914238 RepID=A0A1E1LPE1_9HELO|nr:uncharacterized protein RAG0_16203 [Rhynchosporium agropyri]